MEMFPFKMDNDLFQSTPSAWRVTVGRGLRLHPDKISIHTLRMEGDVNASLGKLSTGEFQSTPSAWRVTHKVSE